MVITRRFGGFFFFLLKVVVEAVVEAVEVVRAGFKYSGGTFGTFGTKGNRWVFVLFEFTLNSNMDACGS